MSETQIINVELGLRRSLTQGDLLELATSLLPSPRPRVVHEELLHGPRRDTQEMSASFPVDVATLPSILGTVIVIELSSRSGAPETMDAA